MNRAVQWHVVYRAGTLLSVGLLTAAEKAIEKLESPNEKIQIQAIRLIFQYSPKLIELGDLENRVRALEKVRQVHTELSWSER
jgi:hypothetical protein